MGGFCFFTCVDELKKVFVFCNEWAVDVVGAGHEHEPELHHDGVRNPNHAFDTGGLENCHMKVGIGYRHGIPVAYR